MIFGYALGSLTCVSIQFSVALSNVVSNKSMSGNVSVIQRVMKRFAKRFLRISREINAERVFQFDLLLCFKQH